MYASLYRHVVFPLYHTLKRDNCVAADKSAHAAEAMDAQAVTAFSRDKLTRLLRKTCTDVPYYRHWLRRHGLSSPEEVNWKHIHDLPLQTKSSITEGAADFLSEDTGIAMIDNSTSGSSGTPFRFKTDVRGFDIRSAMENRGQRWAGVERGEKCAKLWGAQMDVSKGTSLRGTLHGLVTRNLLLSTYAMSEADMAIHLNRLRSFSPEILTSYPGPLYLFAEFCAVRAANIPSLTAIVTSAETLFPYQREKIEQVFGVKVFNRYGCREFGAIAQEDGAGDGLYVNSDHVHVEILDEVGNPCAPGEIGELYVTDLDNFSMPLIRYRIGDRASWALNKGERPFPLIAEIEGRSMAIVKAPNGNNVGGTFWTILLRSRGQLERFQVRQTDDENLLIRYQSHESLAAADEQHFRKEIDAVCGPLMSVAFERVDSFPASKSGKHHFVIRD